MSFSCKSTLRFIVKLALVVYFQFTDFVVFTTLRSKGNVHCYWALNFLGFLELINNMLTSGMVPALFPDDEKEGIIGQVR